MVPVAQWSEREFNGSYDLCGFFSFPASATCMEFSFAYNRFARTQRHEHTNITFNW